ncbi:MAG TPA: hypothetical protein VFK88_09965 [Gallionella sp.]|nr:hypothetical protein [Gallionella sp.]
MKYLWVMLLLPLHALADNSCEKIDSCVYSSMWSDFSELRVTYSDGKEKAGAEFVYMDTPTESLMTFPTKNGTATVFSVPGIATLWHGIGTTGIKTAPGCYENVGDLFAIIQSYSVRALFLIGFGVKGGPELVNKSMPIDASSLNDTRVQINPGDHMIIKGPWSLKGIVKKSESIEFQLAHEFTAEGKTKSLFLRGLWKKVPVSLPVADTQPLGDWLVCMSGTYSTQDGKDQFTPVIEDTKNLKTIGDVRALANSNRQPSPVK